MVATKHRLAGGQAKSNVIDLLFVDGFGINKL